MCSSVSNHQKKEFYLLYIAALNVFSEKNKKMKLYLIKLLGTSRIMPVCPKLLSCKVTD